MKTMSGVQQTSIDAFREIQPRLGEKQAKVLEVFTSQKDWNWTNSELAKLLGWPINCVVPRVFELRQYRLVVESCKRRCEVTGKRVIAWKAKR